MKTKVFKFILPLLVMVMAVSFAFATKSITDNQIAHYFDPLFGWQSVVIGDECGPVGENACEFMGKQLYSQPTTESIALRKD